MAQEAAVTFDEPLRLWLLAVPLAGAIAYSSLRGRRHRFAVRFTNLDLLESVAPQRPGWRRHLASSLALLGITALVLAVARPAMAIRAPRDDATVVLALDVSRSMAADDVSPSRIEAARSAARQFVDLAPDGLRIGVVAFSAAAGVVLAPTTDRLAAQDAVESLRLGDGTAIGEGIYASLSLIEGTAVDVADASPSEASPFTIVVLSDGTSTAGRPDAEAAAAARDMGIPVSTISFGTSSGSIQFDGETVAVPVDQGALRDVATETHGTFFTAATSSELGVILDQIGSRIGYSEDRRDITDIAAAVGLLLTALASGVSLLWFDRLV